MNYTEAISAVNSGSYAWRAAWVPGYYIHKNGSIKIYENEPVGLPYTPTPADEDATDWDSGDHPPHK
jgi:hypothetical protein